MLTEGFGEKHSASGFSAWSLIEIEGLLSKLKTEFADLTTKFVDFNS